MKKKIKKIKRRMEKLDLEELKTPLLLITLIFICLVILSVQVQSAALERDANRNGNIYQKNIALENKLSRMMRGYPIEKMIPYIAQKDEVLAGFLVAIAKKESNWGERVPVLNGEDCYNYWGYRGIRNKMGSDGHTCFDSPKDAVDTVSKRLSFFIRDRGFDTPEDLVVWKCGDDCSGQSQKAVSKWVSDVSYYYDKLNSD